MPRLARGEYLNAGEVQIVLCMLFSGVYGGLFCAVMIRFPEIHTNIAGNGFVNGLSFSLLSSRLIV